MPQPQTIHVVVVGGVVQDVLGVPSGVEVHVLDYDIDSQSSERIQLSPIDGEPCSIAVYSQSPASQTNSPS